MEENLSQVSSMDKIESEIVIVDESSMEESELEKVQKVSTQINK